MIDLRRQPKGFSMLDLSVFTGRGSFLKFALMQRCRFHQNTVLRAKSSRQPVLVSESKVVQPQQA